MSWTRLSDDWTDRAELARLSFEDRWHYLAMIQMCSRGGHVSGVLRVVDARRASDHPDPGAALSRLLEAGLVETVKAGVRLVEIEAHIPPPSVRNKAEADKLRKRRQRAHGAGDHSMCLVGHCPHGVVTRDVTRDPGTGQDGPVLATPDTSVTVTTSWPVRRPGLESWADPVTGAIEEAS